VHVCFYSVHIAFSVFSVNSNNIIYEHNNETFVYTFELNELDQHEITNSDPTQFSPI